MEIWSHLIRTMWFPVGGQLQRYVYVVQLLRCGTSKLWGYDLDLLGSRDVIGHVIVGLVMCSFLLSYGASNILGSRP